MVNRLLRQSSSFLFQQQTSILSAAIVMMVLVLASRILGLARNWFMARYFGVSPVTDAYNAVFVIPDLIANVLITGALSVAFIPIFTSYISKNSRDEANSLASTILNISLIIYMFVGAGIFIFAESLVPLTNTKIDPNLIPLASNLMRLIVLGEFILIIGSFFTSVLQAHQRFLITAMAPVMYNVGIIFGIVVLSRLCRFVGIESIMGVGLGVVVGAILHLFIQYLALHKVGFKYKLLLNFNLPDVIRILKLSLPRALGVGVGHFEVLVNVILASTLIGGSITVMKFSWDLQNLPIGLFGFAFATAALPALSKEWSDDKVEEFRKTFLSSLFQVLYLAIPFSVILAVLRIPIVRLAVGSGEFNWNDTVATATTMSWFAIGVFAQAGFLLVTRAFYAMHDTVTPLKVAIISLAVHIFVAVYFITQFAQSAPIPTAYLGLATSISAVVNFLLLMFLLDKKLGKFNRKQLFYPLVKIVVPSLVMAVFLYVPLHIRVNGEFVIDYIIDTRKALNLLFLTGGVAISGMALYVLLTWWFKSEELKTFVKMIPDLRKVGRILNLQESVDTTHSSPRP